MESRENKPILEHWQKIALLMALYDAFATNASFFLALLTRFDFHYSSIDPVYIDAWKKFAPLYTIACIVVFYMFKLYQSLWRFASYNELLRVICANLVTFAVQCVGITAFVQRMPLSYYAIGGVLQVILVLAVRFSYRFILLLRASRTWNGQAQQQNVMLIGAGNAGQMILRDIRRSKSLDERVACIIDDNPNKWNRYVDGVPVAGGRQDILKAVGKYHISKIYLAIPSATAAQKRDILVICQEAGCEVRQLPGYTQLASGEVSVSQMKEVAVEDLLGREPVRTDMTEVYRLIHGKVVLVTGGGGSIGSELCRQIASHNPRQLIIFDVYENNAYSIQLELKEKYPDLDLVTLIGSVRDSRKMFDLFETYHPQIVYHAAAHKHVPLMEDSPCEAIKNNAIGTYKTAYAAMTHGCERFVLISTDKAVNPTNIMGASKRLCEMIIQSFDRLIKEGRADQIPQLYTHIGEENADKDGTGSVFQNITTQFVAVRFGNVLGSNGSVIPIFKKQIEKGGPVTVTHPDIIRYFMTIPEAVSLVMLAGTYAKGGEIFVLDMGSPVKIDSMARNLIRLSGYRPDIDIKIEYTGLRPGEKLYEERLMAEEGLSKTENEKIFIGKPLSFEPNIFLSQMRELMKAAYSNKNDMKLRVSRIVKTYHPEGLDETTQLRHIEQYRKGLQHQFDGMPALHAGAEHQTSREQSAV